MSDQPRPVWLTREQVDELIRGKVSARSLIAQAWDAAPADATEAARRAVDDGREMADDPALAVLRALGHPS